MDHIPWMVKQTTTIPVASPPRNMEAFLPRVLTGTAVWEDFDEERLRCGVCLEVHDNIIQIVPCRLLPVIMALRFPLLYYCIQVFESVSLEGVVYNDMLQVCYSRSQGFCPTEPFHGPPRYVPKFVRLIAYALISIKPIDNLHICS